MISLRWVFGCVLDFDIWCTARLSISIGYFNEELCVEREWHRLVIEWKSQFGKKDRYYHGPLEQLRKLKDDTELIQLRDLRDVLFGSRTYSQPAKDSPKTNKDQFMMGARVSDTKSFVVVRFVLYDVLKRAGISSRKEALVNFLTDPLERRSTLADILVFGWAGGKHACVDLTGVSPLVGLMDNESVAGQAALKAESSKVAKHEKAYLENQHVFIPFAFDTFGFLAPEADEFLNRVQRVVQSNFSTPKTQNFIFSRIGFAIQKGVAAQLFARLPAILL
ncbi:hypothetical protein Tco_0294958 [Tanacetum coccineum]